MKNYYEILEVSEKASPEIIEKAYKVLAKKHHPDLQEAQNKNVAEEKMKQLNEAYEILSNEQKKAEFDSSLQQERMKSLEKTMQKEETTSTIRYYRTPEAQTPEKQQESEQQQQTYEQNIQKEKLYQKLQQEMQNEYQKQYYHYLRSLGYKIKEKWTWKKTLNFLEAIGIFTILLILLWCIPPVRSAMIEFYEGNVILQGIVNVIVNVVQAIANAIGRLFTNPPKL